MVDNGSGFCFMDSPLGRIRIVASGNRLIEVEFIEDNIPLPAHLEQAALPSVLEACRQQLEAYFSGTLKEFDLPLAAPGTDFQQQV